MISLEAFEAFARFRSAVPEHRRSEYVPNSGAAYVQWLSEAPRRGEYKDIEDLEQAIETWLEDAPEIGDGDDYETSLLAAAIEAP